MTIPVEPGWLSLLPPLVAIALALITREVILSLFAGIWLAALFVVGYNPIAATTHSLMRHQLVTSPRPELPRRTLQQLPNDLLR